MFRTEAIESRKQKLHGDVFLTQPLPFSALTILLFAIIVLVGVMLVTGSYARSEHVVGHLMPSNGLVKIQAHQFGALSDKFVKEGDLVKKGDLLATIDVSQNSANGSSFTQKSREALDRQAAILRVQTTLEQNQLASELAKLRSEHTETQLNISSLELRIDLQREIMSSAKTAFMDAQQLREQGYISKVESERRRQTWLAQQAQVKLREQELAATVAKLQQLEIRLEQVPTESRQRLERLRTQQAELDARLTDLDRQTAYTIKSPVDGRIATISSSSLGQSVRAGQPLMTILPVGSELRAELFVPSRAAGFVEEGQDVRILYDAFPYQRFGSFNAEITNVTEAILLPGEAGAPVDLKEPVYRVTANLDAETLTARGREIALQAGMTLKANIVLERRSFLDWLLEPLRAVKDRA